MTRNEAAAVVDWLRARWPDGVFDEDTWYASALGDLLLDDARRIRRILESRDTAPTPADWNEHRPHPVPNISKPDPDVVRGAIAEARKHLHGASS